MMRRASSSGWQKYCHCEILLVLVMVSLHEKFCAGDFMALNIHKQDICAAQGWTVFSVAYNGFIPVSMSYRMRNSRRTAIFFLLSCARTFDTFYF